MILGLLAERDWTAYELVKQLTTRSIANVVWNLSERTLYREPAKLVAEGLATAVEAGDRPTTYSITDRGRAVLEAARHQRNEFVHQNEILATLYAVAGEPTDALMTRLLDLREEFRKGIAANGQAYRDVASTPPSMPNRALLTALLARLHTHMLLETEQWIGEAIEAVRDVGDGDRGAFAVAEWARIADAIEAAVETWDQE
jgi:DNA-binding PadR family transcriptional regulator